MYNSSRIEGDAHSASDAAAAVSTPKVEAAFVLGAEDAKALADAGFLAAMHGDVQIADCIFAPLCQLRGGRAYPWIGKTLARFNAGRAGEAVVFLEAVTCDDPEEESVLRAWHGLALQLAGHRAQGSALLSKVAHKGGPGAQLARTFLGIKEPVGRRQDDALSNDD